MGQVFLAKVMSTSSFKGPWALLRVRTRHIAGVKTVELQIPRPSDSKVDLSNEKSDREAG